MVVDVDNEVDVAPGGADDAGGTALDDDDGDDGDPELGEDGPAKAFDGTIEIVGVPPVAGGSTWYWTVSSAATTTPS